MTADTSSRLTGIEESGQILSDLSHKNYFTEKHPLTKPVYQYHQFFREFLLSRAKETFTEKNLFEIKRAASALLISTGQVEDAASLMQETGDSKGLTEAICKYANTFISQGRYQTLELWLKAIPQEIIEQTPWLLYWIGTCRLFFEPADALMHLHKAYTLFKDRGDLTGLFLSWGNIVDSFVYQMRNNKPLDKYIDELSGFLKTKPVFPSKEIETRVVSSMAIALSIRMPHHPELHLYLERAIRLLHHSEDNNIKIMVGFHMALHYLWVGDYKKSRPVIDMMREAARHRDASPLMKTTLMSTEAMYHWLNFSYEPCMSAVTEGLKISKDTGVHVWELHLLLHGTNALLGAGDISAAERMLKQIETGLERGSELDICYYHYLVSWKELLEGNLSQSIEHLEKGLEMKDICLPYTEALGYFGMSQALHAKGEFQKAAVHLKKAYRVTRQMISKSLLYMCLIAEAQILLGMGKESKGLKSLQKAMTLGRENGYIHFSWWRPSVMARLCAKALEANIEVEYVQNLIRKRGLVLDVPPRDIKNWPWTLKIFTLGQFKLLKDGEPIQFSRKIPKKPLEILMALVASGGREINDSKLIDNLWTDLEGGADIHAFETALYRLRKLVGNAIIHKEGSLTLDPRCCWVDVWVFEDILKGLDTLLKKGVSEDTQIQVNQLLEKALGFYRGPFLANINQPWSISPRKNLHNRFLQIINRAMEYWKNTGKLDRREECYHKYQEFQKLLLDD